MGAVLMTMLHTALAGFVGALVGVYTIRWLEEENSKESKESKGIPRHDREEKDLLQRRIADIRKLKLGKTPGLFIKSDKVPPALFVGLFGDHSAGKTSLINSVLGAVVGATKQQWYVIASEHSTQDGPGTMYRALAKITDSLVFVDNRGFDLSLGFGEMMKEEMKAQLYGERGYNQIVDWKGVSESGLSPEGQGDKMFCVVLVLGAHMSYDLKSLLDMTTFIQKIQGFHYIGVITNIKGNDDRVRKLRDLMEAANIRDIFEVENLTQEGLDKHEPEMHHVFLNFVERCFAVGDYTYCYRERK